MTLQKLENESYLDFKYRVLVDKVLGDLDASWEEIEQTLQIGMAKDSIRKGSVFLPEFQDYLINKFTKQEELPKYKETTEITKDGHHKSDRLIEMSKQDEKNPEYLLKAHGFDPSEWELVSARNNIWNVSAGANPNKVLYSSRISVKPKEVKFDFTTALEEFKKVIKPITVKQPNNSNGKLLEIPLFDLHFGIADLDFYSQTLYKINEKITSTEWDTILFVIGQDALHNDGFTGKTTSGTPIDKVDMQKAVSDLKKFYVTMINKALEHSKNVEVIFSNGNHDQMVGYMFVQMLEAYFPQVHFDTEMKERKAFIWKDIFIGLTHGDKSGNRTTKAFLSEYGKEMAMAKVSEIHTGHYHHEKSKDDFGIVVRTLSTGAKTDDYHYEKGFIGAMKRFQIFEYSAESLEAVYYV